MAEIDDTYAEAFRSIYAEVLITARDRTWLKHAVNAVTGNASSSILCDCEAGLDRFIEDTPDGPTLTTSGRACPAIAPYRRLAQRGLDARRAQARRRRRARPHASIG